LSPGLNGISKYASDFGSIIPRYDLDR